MTIEDLSQSVHGYQLFPLATSYLFLGALLIVGGGELTSIEDPSLSGHLS